MMAVVRFGKDFLHRDEMLGVVMSGLVILGNLKSCMMI